MAELEKKPVKIVETVLRDAHQSLIATRLTTEQMLPIVDKMDKVGYHAVECWGGATFDASLRFLKEDPWERLRMPALGALPHLDKAFINAVVTDQFRMRALFCD